MWMSVSLESTAVTPSSFATTHMSEGVWSVSTQPSVSTHKEDMSAAAEMDSLEMATPALVHRASLLQL